MPAKTFNQASEEFLEWSKARGRRPNTLRRRYYELKKVSDILGNPRLDKITTRDMDGVFAKLSESRAEGGINCVLGTCRVFFEWCRNRKLVSKEWNPIADLEFLTIREKPRPRVPVTQFPAMLDAARHPRDRCLIAAGLYLFLRQSEIRTLKVGDVNLDSGEVNVQIWKTGQSDIMPISLEMDRELRKWLTFYGERMGQKPEADWLLFPYKGSSGLLQGENGRFTKRPEIDDILYPYKPMFRIEEIAKHSLKALGWEMYDVDGRPMQLGMHVLRRSAARAAFDELTARGYDGALKMVQTWLHHKNASMTEHYLGLTLDKERRNKDYKGTLLYPSIAESVKIVSINRAM
jgi:integrase